MTDIYIIKPHEQISRLNELLYFHFVTEDGLNFKFPYMEGTDRYIAPLDEAGTVCAITPAMVEFTKSNTEAKKIIGNVFYNYQQLIDTKIITIIEG